MAACLAYPACCEQCQDPQRGTHSKRVPQVLCSDTTIWEIGGEDR